MSNATTSEPSGASSRSAWGAGLATIAADGKVLDTWFPSPRLGAGPGADTAAGTTRLDDAGVKELLGEDAAAALGHDPVRDVDVVAVATSVADLDAPPSDPHDAYLRLHLLSHCLIRPNGCNLEGIFGVLNNVVWTAAGPCAVEGFEATRLRLRGAGRVPTVYGVDKFPRMIDYVVPAGVRIADADRVRLGAHLAPGTTVMHEGYCNFNGGTLGSSMIEGRISQGVVIGDGSDLGGGATTMGTLSGGGKERVSVGERCLIGSEAGLGIALGDDCTVEAGLYVTAGTLVSTPDGQVVKARDLSGRSGLLFRRNSQSGRVEVLSRTVDWGALNAELHAND